MNRSANLFSRRLLSMASTSSRKTRIVIIVGATSTGKTQLALDIASEFHGEIINADLVQMYRGLDVATAKIAVADRAGIPHHLLSFMDPTQPFNVQEFHTMASAAISDIAARGRLPIIVGGTLYYSQSLLRNSLLREETVVAEPRVLSRTIPPPDEIARAYSRLCTVDPVSAERLHPHDWRKI